MLKQERGQYQEALSRVQELSEKRDALIDTYNAFSKEDLDRLARIVPDKVNTVKLVTDIDSIAGKYGITVRSVRVTDQVADNSQVVGGGTPANPYQTTTLTFSFSSSYEKLVPFLKDLEKSLQMIDINSVNFQVPTGTTANGIYQYAISLQTYWLK